MYKELKESFINDEWTGMDGYTIKHKNKKIVLWIANGFFSFTGNEEGLGDNKCQLRIPFYMRIPLWFYCRQMINRYWVKELKKKGKK
jgi:hypothetical protein